MMDPNARMQRSPFSICDFKAAMPSRRLRCEECQPRSAALCSTYHSSLAWSADSPAVYRFPSGLLAEARTGLLVVVVLSSRFIAKALA